MEAYYTNEKESELADVKFKNRIIYALRVFLTTTTADDRSRIFMRVLRLLGEKYTEAGDQAFLKGLEILAMKDFCHTSSQCDVGNLYIMTNMALLHEIMDAIVI